MATMRNFILLLMLMPMCMSDGRGTNSLEDPADDDNEWFDEDDNDTEGIAVIDQILDVNDKLDDETKAKLTGGDIISEKEERRKRRGLMKNTSMKWTDAVVAYTFDVNFDKVAIQAIKEAMAHISKASCIKFREKGNDDNDYVSFVKKSGCASHVGKIGGGQELRVGRGCERKSIIIHELLHVLGFHHEQNRPDRDDYITVNFDHIRKGIDIKKNFGKFGTDMIDSGDSPYDKQGIMHFSNYAFAKNRSKMVLESKTNAMEKLGGAQGLSSLDTAQLNKFYNCKVNGNWSNWGKWETCERTEEEYEDEDDFEDNSISNTEKWTCTKTRTRTCDNPVPAGGGEDCEGDDEHTEQCTECKIDGDWSYWGEWSTCSISCGTGQRSRSRECSNPSPSNGGKSCKGNTVETRECNTEPCPAAWSDWDEWSPCGEHCTKSRSRSCLEADRPVPSDLCSRHGSRHGYQHGSRHHSRHEKSKDWQKEKCTGGDCESIPGKCPPAVDHAKCDYLNHFLRHLCRRNINHVAWLKRIQDACPRTCNVKQDCGTENNVCSHLSNRIYYRDQCTRVRAHYCRGWFGWFWKQHCARTCCERDDGREKQDRRHRHWKRF